MLKAQGHSYREIGESLGWTYTKVNRCITEGRARFLKVYAEIEAGAECERFAPDARRARGGHGDRGRAARAPPPHPQLPGLPRDGPRAPRDPPRPARARSGRSRSCSPRCAGSGAGTAPMPVTPDQTSSPSGTSPDVHEATLELPEHARWQRGSAGRAQGAALRVAGTGSRAATSSPARSSPPARGGGRIATIGAIVGFCLSGLGAGTVCVVTGVIDNPFVPGPGASAASRAREPRRSRSRRHARPAAP